MDAKTAISILRNHGEIKMLQHRVITLDHAGAIANLIESLSRDAELGRAAIKAVDMVDTDLSNQLCSEPVFDNNRSCQSCAWQDFCRLRAGEE